MQYRFQFDYLHHEYLKNCSVILEAFTFRLEMDRN